MFSKVIEVADSEYDIGFHSSTLDSEIYVFYHLREYALGRPGRRSHLHIGQNFVMLWKRILLIMKIVSSVCKWEKCQGNWCLFVICSIIFLNACSSNRSLHINSSKSDGRSVLWVPQRALCDSFTFFHIFSTWFVHASMTGSTKFIEWFTIRWL